MKTYNFTIENVSVETCQIDVPDDIIGHLKLKEYIKAHKEDWKHIETKVWINNAVFGPIIEAR